MEILAADALARELMSRHGLADWGFSFDRSRRRFGACHWDRKTITLSRWITELNGEEPVRETLLHEIAHALVGAKAGHGPQWKAVARELGAQPRRCYRDSEILVPSLPYIYRCLACGSARQVARRSRGKRSCGRCSRVFDPRFLLCFESNPAFAR